MKYHFIHEKHGDKVIFRAKDLVAFTNYVIFAQK